MARPYQGVGVPRDLREMREAIRVVNEHLLRTQGGGRVARPPDMTTTTETTATPTVLPLFTEVWSYVTSSTIGDLAYTTPTVEDIDGDGVNEIILLGWNMKVHVLTPAGANKYTTWTLTNGPGADHTTYGYVTVIPDQNNDGKKELVIGTHDGQVWCLKGDLSAVLWAAPLKNWYDDTARGKATPISDSDRIFQHGGTWAARTFTTVNGGATGTGTSLTVVSTTGLIAGQHIQIDSERITIGTVASGTSLTGCTRGVDGTANVTHINGSNVRADVLFLTGFDGHLICVRAFDGVILWDVDFNRSTTLRANASLTQLNGAITDVATTVVVDSTADMAVGTVLLCGTEQIRVNGVTDAVTFTTLAAPNGRGYSGTTAAAHADNDGVGLFGIDAAATTIFINGTDATAYSANQVVLIKWEGSNTSEQIQIGGTTSSAFTGVTRAYGGTTASKHAAGAGVYLNDVDIEAQPVARDVDADGEVEVILANVSNLVKCYEDTGAVKWSNSDSGYNTSTCMVGDVTGDGTLDVVFNGGAYIPSQGKSERVFVCLASTGSSAAYTLPSLHLAMFSSQDTVPIAAVMLDGQRYVYLADDAGNVYCVYRTSSGWTQKWSRHISDSVLNNTPCLLDVNQDGQREVLLGLDEGYLLTLDGLTGETLDTYNFPQGNSNIEGSIVGGDIDGDGFVEVLVPVRDQNMIVCLRAGRTYPGNMFRRFAFSTGHTGFVTDTDDTVP